MAYNDIKPVKETKLVGRDYVPCDEHEATHWLIEIGFDGAGGFLILPSRKAAEACFKAFVLPYERGLIKSVEEKVTEYKKINSITEKYRGVTINIKEYVVDSKILSCLVTAYVRRGTVEKSILKHESDRRFVIFEQSFADRAISRQAAINEIDKYTDEQILDMKYY